ncbi:MAG TPA: tRNA 4-thiouridine(8) synthase ThiI [Syntrophomonas sp.]|jgi:tRNA U34 2-thiouridine synthase MnmA/TrmU|nr:tRNA 4-thiouridine(8) synthase ThiI [Syntrophomonas sp.]
MKAISLFSGGLDSQLACQLIRRQGIEVIAVCFQTPFFGSNPSIQTSAARLGIDLHLLEISDEYMSDILLKPRYGYGKNFNPCIDCHGFMLRKAGDHMKETGASFLITGEVLGQRPMSQNKSSLGLVEKLSGYPGLIVRPLSAKLLPPTIPEREGWIDREQLLDISGRGRTRQMALAEEFGITDYPSPAGGCLLTEPGFARRLKRLLEYRNLPTRSDTELLKTGRHFYVASGTLLVVGRNHSENEQLKRLAIEGDVLIKMAQRPGPTGLLRIYQPGTPDMAYAASIVARYSDAKSLPEADAKILDHEDNLLSQITVMPLSPELTPAMV